MTVVVMGHREGNSNSDQYHGSPHVMCKQVIVEIPFEVVNAEKSPGVKKGGMLNVVMPKV